MKKCGVAATGSSHPPYSSMVVSVPCRGAVMEVSDDVSNPAIKSTTAAKKATMKTSGVTKKSPVTATGSSHPGYSCMVVATIRSLSSRTGVSRQAIIKKMKDDYDLGDNETKIANWVRITLKKGLESNYSC